MKIIKVLMSILLAAVFAANVRADVLKAGVAVEVPSGFYGTWRVVSTLIDTNSKSNFKQNNVDIWNLSQENGVFNLSNPFSGASASVTVNSSENNTIKFTRKGNYYGKILTDVVEIKLDGNRFTGVNTLELQTLSEINNSVIKTVNAKYTLKGEKIAGLSIKED